MEVVEGGVYRRSISLHGHDGYFEATCDPDNDTLSVRIHFGDPRSLFVVIERIRAMFDLNADPAEIARCLVGDPALAERINAAPGIRVPGCWNGFELAVRTILGQQISVKGATTLAGRLATKFGRTFSGPSGLTHFFPPAEVLADANVAVIGLPKARAQTIQALARAVRDRQISFEGIVDTDSFRDQLCTIPGIGKWTAEYVTMRALREPDAFPSSDLGLLRALGLKRASEFERRAEAWRPWRAYAAMYFWSAGRSQRDASGNQRLLIGRTSKQQDAHAMSL